MLNTYHSHELQMKPSWKKKESLKAQIILDRMDKLKIVNENEPVSFKSEALFIPPMLIQAIDFGEKSEELDQEKILEEAIRNVAKENKLTEDAVIEEVDKIVNKELAVKEKPYRFLTSLSVLNNFPIKKIKIEGMLYTNLCE